MANKTWADIRSETVNLGFEKIKSYEKNRDAYIQAYNYAQGLIASTTDPIMDKLVIEKAGQADTVYDLAALCADRGISLVGLAPVGVTDPEGQRIDNITLLQGRYLTVAGGYTGTLWVYIRKMPQPITTASADNTAVEISDKWAGLMPYLMANRLFMDDNAALAGYYYNMYDDARAQLLAADNSPAVTVITPENTEGWW